MTKKLILTEDFYEKIKPLLPEEIQGNVKEITISMAVDEIPTVTVKYMITKDQADRLPECTPK